MNGTAKCDPAVQIPGKPFDSCDTKPPLVDTAAAFGIVGQPLDREKPGYDWSVCDPVIPMICDQMAAADTTASRVSKAFLSQLFLIAQM